MMLVPILLLIGCVVAFALTTLDRDPDKRSLVVALTLVWLAAYGLWRIDRLDLLPALDWLVGAQALAVGLYRNPKWLRYFVAIIALRPTFHVVFYLSSDAYLVLYAHGLNVTFAFLLMVVSHAGGAHARNHLLGQLSRLFGSAHAALRTPPQVAG
jgi:hypothetical protein